MKQIRLEKNIVVEVAPEGAEYEPGLFLQAPDAVDIGWHHDGTDFTAPSAEETATRKTEELHYAQDYAIPAIDEAAEQDRAAHLTPGDGQMLVYEAKIREAIRFTHSEEAVQGKGDWPYLMAEKTAAGSGNLLDAARRIIDRRKVVDHALATIEVVRLKAKRKIAEATTPQAVAKIVEGMAFSSPS